MKKFIKETDSPRVFPRPAALITCSGEKGDNIITMSWIATLCSIPPIIGMGIRKNRFSHSAIVQKSEFVVNIPGEELVKEADYCGTHSGRDVDKFKETGLTRENARVVSVPMIKECPINIECKLTKAIDLGSHTLFLGEVVGTHIDEKIMTIGALDDTKFKPLTYLSPHYCTVAGIEEKYGFTK
jgi:flavin reductase (DIM6/NTAB) family NADH-FMN oxidoreductase RutF